jgi:uncharacterized membrane protein
MASERPVHCLKGVLECQILQANEGDRVRTVAGVFPSKAEAEKAKMNLQTLGIAGEDIIIAVGDAHCLKNVMSAERNMTAAAVSGAGWLLAGLIREVVYRRSTAAGTGVGALAGVISGAILGFIVRATPSSPFAAANVFAVILGAMAIGATAGGLVACIYCMGVSHEGIAFCAEAAREQGIVVAAHVSESTEPDAIRVMNKQGAANLRGAADPWRASGWTGPHPKEQPYPSDSSVKAHEVPGLRPFIRRLAPQDNRSAPVADFRPGSLLIEPD